MEDTYLNLLARESEITGISTNARYLGTVLYAIQIE